MDWTLSGDRAIWLQLKERIAVGIVTGEYPPGSRLPSVRELAMQAGVNPNTMQRALSELEKDELVHTMGTAGRQITSDVEKMRGIRREQAQKFMETYLGEMKELGYEPCEASRELEEWINGTTTDSN